MLHLKFWMETFYIILLFTRIYNFSQKGKRELDKDVEARQYVDRA